MQGLPLEIATAVANTSTGANVRRHGRSAVRFGFAVVVWSAMPPARTVAWGLLLGSLSYGVSVVLAVHAMRLIGVALPVAFEVRSRSTPGAVVGESPVQRDDVDADLCQRPIQ